MVEKNPPVVSKNPAMVSKNPAVIQEQGLDACEAFGVGPLQLGNALVCLRSPGQERRLVLSQSRLTVKKGCQRLF